MNGAATLAALVLAAVFGWAALAKAVRHEPTVVAFTELGLPRPAALAAVVPAAELVVAVTLLIRPDVGGVLALGALGTFTIVVVRALSRGGDAGCGCFGSSRIEPISPADVVRNGLLAAFAALATGTRELVRPTVGSVVAMTAAVGAAVAAQAAARHLLGRVRA